MSLTAAVSPLSALSLRTRILLWHGTLLAAVLVAFGVTAFRLHWAGELHRVDREFDEPLSRLHRSLHSRSPQSRDAPRHASTSPDRYVMPEENAALFALRGWEYTVWNREGRLLAHSPRMEGARPILEAVGAEPFVVRRQTRGTWREAYLFTPPGECFLAAVSLEKDLEDAARLGISLTLLGAGVLVIALLIDAWILRRAIRPVEDIIDAAERISEGRLSTRIETVAAENTELGRLAAVLNRTFGRLDETFAQQARFSADVAHELRTPVSVLIAESQGTLERPRSAEEYRETIATTLRSANRMRSLIEFLLDLARIKSGPETDCGPCDLARIAAEVVESLAPLAVSHGIGIRRQFQRASCHANTDRIARVISNLLANAIQHNERGGHAAVTTGVEDGEAILWIENTGPGIPPGDLPHVFDRFFRSDASRSRRTGGAGLGLSICKAIIESHAGRIKAESRPGGMTRFTVRIPGGG